MVENETQELKPTQDEEPSEKSCPSVESGEQNVEVDWTLFPPWAHKVHKLCPRHVSSEAIEMDRVLESKEKRTLD